jgi:hypothetical protein
MPYVIRPERGRWAVRKKWTGKLVGRTDSKHRALAMVRAIYASKGKK